MASLNWNDVVELSTDDAKQSILTFLDGIGFSATSWQEGSNPLACVEIGALVWSTGSKYAVFLKNLALNETSNGDGLTRFSVSHYQNFRQNPIAAQRLITLVCATGQGPYSLGLGDVVVEDSQAHTFRNIAGNTTYPVSLSSGGSLTLLFEAEVAGAASQVAPGAVNSLVTTFAGVAIVADFVVVVGQNAEPDPKLQARNSSKWATLGFELIRDGAENIALNTIGVTRVAIDDTNPRGQATFDVYLAQPGATATDAQVLSAQSAFNARVFGDAGTCLVKPAPTVALNLVGTVYFDSRFAQSDVRASVEAALTAFVASVPLGGFDFAPGPTNIISLTDIINAVKDATFSSQKCVRTLTLVTPSADIAMPSFTALIGGDYSGLTYTATTNG